uniref:HDC17317 n=1 Tax=Drosophila melanogaster TaxID=7227 RepID=Q6IIR2_DROME|nr:TPA_inf: HDC17317 [Drosophila melanogaster]
MQLLVINPARTNPAKDPSYSPLVSLLLSAHLPTCPSAQLATCHLVTVCCSRKMQMSGIKLKWKLRKKAMQTAKIPDPKCLNEKQRRQRRKGEHTQDQPRPGFIDTSAYQLHYSITPRQDIGCWRRVRVLGLKLNGPWNTADDGWVVGWIAGWLDGWVALGSWLSVRMGLLPLMQLMFGGKMGE